MTFNDDPYEIFLCGPGNDEHSPEAGESPAMCADLSEVGPAPHTVAPRASPVHDWIPHTNGATYQTFGVGPFTSNPCVDGSAEPEPSCGWRFPSSFSTSGTTWAERKDAKLKDSQGFCCEVSSHGAGTTSTPSVVSSFPAVVGVV